MVPAPSDADFLRQALDEAMRASREAAPKEGVSFYHFALQQSWIHMSRVMGPLGAKVIFEHSARTASRRCPELRSLVVTDGGVDFATFSLGNGPDLGPSARCLEELCISVLQTLSELTGNVVLGPLLAALKAGMSH